jgi:hypothetical protein
VEEGSSGVGNSHSTEQIFKDFDMPDGDACRPDGTLKDASEMEWPDSPTEGNVSKQTQLSEDGYNSKRSLPQACDDKESESESDGPPRTKVNYNSITRIL